MTTAQIGDEVEITKEAEADADAVSTPAVEDAEGQVNSSHSPQDSDADVDTGAAVPVRRRISWIGVVTYGLVPAVALLLALTAGWLKWQDSTLRAQESGASETVKAASEATTAMLSYKADSVEQDLHAAQTRLTGSFKDSYVQLTNDVVIPGAKAQHISAVARISAAGSSSVTPNHAVVLLFVNQTVVIGKEAPTDTASVVRVSMDRVGDRWLVSAFEPI